MKNSSSLGHTAKKNQIVENNSSLSYTAKSNPLGWLKYGPHSKKKNQRGTKQLNEGLFG
jgi:hypothetical protein